MKTNLKLNTKANNIITKTLYSVYDDNIPFHNYDVVNKAINGIFTFSISVNQYENTSSIYSWVLSTCPINDPENSISISGSTIEEFEILQKRLAKLYKINLKNKLIMYVFDLPTIYTYFKKKFNFIDIRSKGKHLEFKVTQDNGFIWKSTKDLTALSNLEDLTKTDYVPFKYKPTNDGLLNNLTSSIIQLYFLSLMSLDNGYTSLQNTACGIAKDLVRSAIHRLVGNDELRYNTWRKHLSLDVDKYIILNKALYGGDISFNENRLNEIQECTSYDKSSSYSSVMVSKKYPFDKMVKVECDEKRLYNLLEHDKLFIVDCYFNDVVIKDNKTPLWKAEDKHDVKNKAEKLVKSKRFNFVGTNIDFNAFIEYYNYSSIDINKTYVFNKSDYLPNWFRYLICDLYKKKTSYKNVDEALYRTSKMKLENMYGLAVKNPVYIDGLDKNNYDSCDKEKIQEALDKYNKNKYDYLIPYCIGVFVTAYARQDLRIMREKLENDFIMCDTDSLKFVNDHSKEFEEHNNKLYEDMINSGLSTYDFIAVDKYGVVHQLGEWQYEGHGQIKVVGLKQYGYIDDNGSQKTTIAGCSKKAIDYLKSIGLSALNISTDLEIPPEYSGKYKKIFYDDFVIIKKESFKIGTKEVM